MIFHCLFVIEQQEDRPYRANSLLPLSLSPYVKAEILHLNHIKLFFLFAKEFVLSSLIALVADHIATIDLMVLFL